MTLTTDENALKSQSDISQDDAANIISVEKRANSITNLAQYIISTHTFSHPYYILQN
jgi:hypothetical protein